MPPTVRTADRRFGSSNKSFPGGNAATSRIQADERAARLRRQPNIDFGRNKSANSIAAHANDGGTVPVKIWRETQTPHENVRDLKPGKLGVVLESVAEKSARPTPLLAKLRGGDWLPLPGHGASSSTGSPKLFGPAKSTILAGSDASETEALRNCVWPAKLKDYRYVHFATHGEANNVQGVRVGR